MIWIFALFLSAAAAGDPEGRALAALLDTLGPSCTVEEAAFGLLRLDRPASDLEAARERLDGLARGLREKSAGAEKAQERTEALRSFLFEESRFEAAADLKDEDSLYLDAVLASRKGHCLGLSVLILCLGERLGWPLHGVGAPDHFFVRYDDGRTRINVETLRRGASPDDAAYAAELKIAPPPPGRAASFLSNLKGPEVLAYLLNNRGVLAMERGEEARARASFGAALRLRPSFPEALRNLGALEGRRRAFREAASRLEEALALHPSDLRAWKGLAVAAHGTGDFGRAFEAWREAAHLAPADAEIGKRLVEAQAEFRDREFPRWQAAEAERNRKALEGKERRPGLAARYFEGTNFERELLRRADPAPFFNWQNEAPAPEVPPDGFSARWEGYIEIPKASAYTFYLTVNDGGRVVLDGRTLLESWENRGFENHFERAETELAQGPHRIRVEFFDAGGGARILLHLASREEKDPLPLSKLLFHAGE